MPAELHESAVPVSTAPSSDIVVSQVVSAAERKAFIRFQYEVYQDNSPFVPPLEMDRENVLSPKKNPWFEFGTAQFFLARRGGKIVGRIAAIEDPRYNEYHGTKTGWFGFFESLNDAAVARALLHTAEVWVKNRGLTQIMGPASFSSNSEWGFLLTGFDKAPAIMMPYTPEYYLALAESAGYTKAKDLFAWEIDVTREAPEKVVRIAEKIKQREAITIRPANMKNWEQEVRLIKEIYNSAWEKNWGFVPMTDAEFDLMGKELKLILNTDLVLFAEVKGEPVAFCITVPDANQAIKKANGRLTTFGVPVGLVKMLLELKKVKRGRLIALGIRKEFRRRGLDSLLVYETFKAGKKLGWTSGEIGWTLEDNDLVNRVIEVFGSTKSKTYRVYQKSLASAAS
jgi:GNAT superfamily N-acetyltransferase